MQIWNLEHQSLHFPNLKNFGSLGRKEKRNFFRSLNPEFETRPMSYILFCDIHQIKSVLTAYHLPGYNYFTRFGKQKQKLSWLIFGCTLLDDQTSNSNHFIVVKISAWLSLICWVVPAGHLWAFDKHNASSTEGLGLLHMRRSEVKGLIIFLGFILSAAGICRPYIEFRETYKSSLSFFRYSFWKLSGLLPQGVGGVHMEGSIETQ